MIYEAHAAHTEVTFKPSCSLLVNAEKSVHTQNFWLHGFLQKWLDFARKYLQNNAALKKW